MKRMRSDFMSWLPLSTICRFFFVVVLKLFSMYLQNASLPSVCVCVFVCRVCSDGRMEPWCHLVRTNPDANLPLQQGCSRWGLSRTLSRPLFKVLGRPSGIYQRVVSRGSMSAQQRLKPACCIHHVLSHQV